MLVGGEGEKEGDLNNSVENFVLNMFFKKNRLVRCSLVCQIKS